MATATGGAVVVVVVVVVVIVVVTTTAAAAASTAAITMILFHRRRRRQRRRQQTFIGDDEGDGVGCRARDKTVLFSWGNGWGFARRRQRTQQIMMVGSA